MGEKGKRLVTWGVFLLLVGTLFMGLIAFLFFIVLFLLSILEFNHSTSCRLPLESLGPIPTHHCRPYLGVDLHPPSLVTFSTPTFFYYPVFHLFLFFFLGGLFPLVLCKTLLLVGLFLALTPSPAVD